MRGRFCSGLNRLRTQEGSNETKRDSRCLGFGCRRHVAVSGVRTWWSSEWLPRRVRVKSKWLRPGLAAACLASLKMQLATSTECLPSFLPSFLLSSRFLLNSHLSKCNVEIRPIRSNKVLSIIFVLYLHTKRDCHAFKRLSKSLRATSGFLVGL